MTISSVNNRNNISFSGNRMLMRLVDTDFYTGKYVKRCNRSTEHIRPRSHGGLNDISNYAMVDKTLNSDRGNLPLRDWLIIHPEFVQNIKNYIEKYWNLVIDGRRYGPTLQNTMRSLDTYV